MNLNPIAVILLASCLVLICVMGVFYRIENKMSGSFGMRRHNHFGLLQQIEVCYYILGVYTTKQIKLLRLMRFLILVIIVYGARLLFKYGPEIMAKLGQ